MDSANGSAAAKVNERTAGDYRQADGRYSVRTWETLCTCGHSLEVHAAHGGHECINGDFGDPCDCEKFRKSRKATK